MKEEWAKHARDFPCACQEVANYEDAHHVGAVGEVVDELGS